MFAPELPGLDRDEIRAWYNGYNWRGDEKVCNPFDILRLFDKREFDAGRSRRTPRPSCWKPCATFAPQIWRT